MKDYRVAGRYARALLALAEERSELDRIEQELFEASQIVERYPEISHLIANATVSFEEKEDFIGKILPSSFSPLLVNFLKVLIQKKRFAELALVREVFHRLYEDKKGIQRVRVESPIPMDSELEKKLAQTIEKKFKRKVYLDITVHPEILGGFILDFEGAQIDTSYRTLLAELKQRLLAPYA